MTGIAKSFGAVRAVTDLDLTIDAGEAVALLGPNGAGKSTTINMMLGLVPPDRGSVELFGVDPERAIIDGQVGAMLQDQLFLPNATVRDFIGLARRLYPRSPDMDTILAAAGLTDVAGTKLNKLSGGEAKRARFAFALAGNPNLLVLDEPTAAMDVAGRQTFWAAMRQYSQRGNAVIFATHYLAEADDFADRVIVIDRGLIIADGTTDAIKRLASSRRVAFDLAGGVPDGFDRLPGVRGMDLRGDRVHLTTEDSDQTVIALVASQRPFANLEVAGADLEEAFLTLTSVPSTQPALAVPEA
jgi:ABC-2 type transport system ATP-binding protein